jgi:hypothetical protein
VLTFGRCVQVRGGEVKDVPINTIATIRDVMTTAADGDYP